MKHFSFLLAPALVSTFGCLAPPPCPEPQTAANSGTGAAPTAGAAAAPVAASGPSDPGDLSKPLVVWNGDDVSPTAKEWASCDKPCTATLLPTAKVGKGGTQGLEFKVSTKAGYVGFGWNWTSWYKGGATNITGRKKLKFSVQVIAASPEVMPAGEALRVGIRCAKVEKCGKVVENLAKYAPKVTDGQWHDVEIPLGDLKTEDKDEWDDGTAWEFNMHNWAPTPRDFVVHIDDIRFE